MRYLLYYPMIHIDHEDYLINAIVSSYAEIMGKKFRKGEISEEEALGAGASLINYLKKDKKGLKKIMREVDDDWNRFTDYLRGQESFDRVYLEGTMETGRIEGFKRRKSGMNGCITYLKDSGAIFEKTEDEIINEVLDDYMGNKVLLEAAQVARERGVYTQIKKTLGKDERGLLLFGNGHIRGLYNNFSRSRSINFYIYDPKTNSPIKIISQ